MGKTVEWDPIWGPRIPPRPRRFRKWAKACVARLASAGRSPADPSRGVAVLAYHGTGPHREDPWWLDFRGQMALVDDLGFEIISLDDVAEFVRGDTLFDRPKLAITFDDGFASNLAVAYPELARRGWPATVFIATSYIGRRPYVMSEEIEGIIDHGIDIGNHTDTHALLNTLSPAEIGDEIRRSQAIIEDLTGRRCRHFCYPNGIYNPAAREVIAGAGFDSACAGRVGWNMPGQDPYVLKRVTLPRGGGPSDLRVRLAGGYDFLDRRQRHMDRG